MTRLLFISLAVTMLDASAMAAQKAMPPDVRSTLEKAVVNERDAVERYTEYAAKADAEGYPGAAALFRAQARAEKIHGKRFAQALKNAAISIPEDAASKPEVGTTEDNLRAAASAERDERDGFYRDAVNACRRSGDESTAKMFDQTRDAEAEHANLDVNAARNLDPLKTPRTFHVCGHCGYVTDVRLPLCPSCRGQLDTVR